MRKQSSRGRGRGRGGVSGPSGAGRGRGRSATATASSEPSTSGPGSRQNLNRYLVGPNAVLRMVRPEQVQALVDWVADSASSTFTTLSHTQSSAESAQMAPENQAHQSVRSPPCISGKQPEPEVMQQSLILFEDSAGRVSQGHPPSPSAAVEDIPCTDAQPLMFPDDEDMGIPPQQSHPVSDDDETQVPTAASYCSVQAEQEEVREEDWVEDDAEDDEVLDPTWTEGRAADLDSSQEEAVVRPRKQRSQRESRGQKQTSCRPESSPATGQRQQGLSTPKATSRSSLAWHFFKQCADDKARVICTLCHQSLRRGVNVLNLSTTCMTRHLHAKHELQWSKHLKNKELSQATPAHSTAAASAPAPATGGMLPPADPHTEDVPPTPPPPPTASPSNSTLSPISSVQLSISQTFERKRKFSPSHPRALGLNASISKLLAFEMLSFRLVDTDGFKQLMAMAVPQYVVPSRHYFSKTAVPSLHKQVSDQIKCALRNAICGKVHLTTDTWTSKHGQGRYISLTAHWVNVVAAGPQTESSFAHVLPPPRIAGHHSLPPVASSSYSASSSTASTSSSSQTHTVTTNFSTARGKRQQAVLKLICLGDRPHTAQELWRGIEQQTDEWLLPVGLKPGLVVCDNGRNLVAALGLAGLTHIPCLAHVLNLVVQKFLHNYPDMSELLHKVRAVCARFRRSHPAAARLSALQRNFALPAHRLICDVPTRWNSTLHMLERLCEQQQAIVEFQLQHARVSRTAEQHHFTTSDWASMRDLCALLRCFEYSTNMASGDDSVISLTIPLLCLLEKTLRAMMEEEVAREEEEEEEGSFLALSGQSVRSGSEGGLFQQQRAGTNAASQGPLPEDEEDEEEVEEDEEEAGSQRGVTQHSSGTSLVRGWGDIQDDGDTPPTEDSLSLTLGSLAHMSDYMLQCLRNDSRVAHILTCADYWVATLLDPRYKDNVPTLLPALERDRKMREYKRTLVDALLRAFPNVTGEQVEGQGRGGARGRQRSFVTASSSEGRVSMAEMWKSFVSTPQINAPPPDTERVSRRQHFTNMVEQYVCTSLHVLTDGSAPFNFWVSKLSTWPELACYALEVLSCPAASVLSERVFSTAGGVITDKRSRLSTANVDKLTFIKMNQAWIPQDLALPAAE